MVTFDHTDAKDYNTNSVVGHKFAVVGVDVATRFVMSRPLVSKTATSTAHELRMWRGRERLIHMHSDGSGELAWVCKYEGITGRGVFRPGTVLIWPEWEFV